MKKRIMMLMLSFVLAFSGIAMASAIPSVSSMSTVEAKNWSKKKAKKKLKKWIRKRYNIEGDFDVVFAEKQVDRYIFYVYAGSEDLGIFGVGIDNGKVYYMSAS